MNAREGSCRCGQFRVRCTGDPVRVSICHCLDCQRRSGSAFSFQARWPDDQVEQFGTSSEWSAVGESGSKATFRFCPICGGGVTYRSEVLPGLTAVAVGAFAEPEFPQPDYSVYETRKHRWIDIWGPGIEHFD